MVTSHYSTCIRLIQDTAIFMADLLMDLKMHQPLSVISIYIHKQVTFNSLKTENLSDGKMYFPYFCSKTKIVSSCQDDLGINSGYLFKLPH